MKKLTPFTFAMLNLAGVGPAVPTASSLRGFVPPDKWTGRVWTYEVVLLAGIFALGIGPFLFFRFRRPDWAAGNDHPTE